MARADADCPKSYQFMIISHRHKFIFVKTRKVAGSTIERVLAEQCGPEDIISPDPVPVEKAQHYAGRFNPIPELVHTLSPLQHARTIRDWVKRPKYYCHLSSYSIRHRIGAKVWDNYFKFTFERNPWDKMVSFYYWYHRYRIENGEPLPTFREHVLERANALHEDRRFPLDWKRYTLGGEVAMDYIGRFENLEGDLATVFERIGLTKPPSLPREKGNVRGDRRHYSEAYDDATRDRIAELFHREIEHFGYEFATPATV